MKNLSRELRIDPVHDLMVELLEGDKPDLVILDINMPEMDRNEVLKFMKGDDRYKDIPVFIVSSISNPDTDKRLLEEGAQAVIKKPVSPSKFMEPIEALNLRGESVTDGW